MYSEYINSNDYLMFLVLYGQFAVLLSCGHAGLAGQEGQRLAVCGFRSCGHALLCTVTPLPIAIGTPQGGANSLLITGSRCMALGKRHTG